MIPMYNYAVVPFFCSCTFYFAVVLLFLQLYILLPDPILVDCRTILKHKHTASLTLRPYVRVVVSLLTSSQQFLEHMKIKESGSYFK